MTQIIVYSDGSCIKDNVGGWGAILMLPEGIKKIAGKVIDTTNNRMELVAVIKAVEFFTEPSSLNIKSDSAYVVDTFKNRRYEEWERNGWKTTSGDVVENQDLINRLIELRQKHKLQFEKVKAHWGEGYTGQLQQQTPNQEKDRFFNKLADKIATDAAHNIFELDVIKSESTASKLYIKGLAGSWAYIFDNGVEGSGESNDATSNQMELYAAIVALKTLPKDSKIEIFSELHYIVDIFKNKSYKKWNDFEWYEKKNASLIKELVILNESNNITWTYTGGIKIKDKKTKEVKLLASRTSESTKTLRPQTYHVAFKKCTYKNGRKKSRGDRFKSGLLYGKNPTM